MEVVKVGKISFLKSNLLDKKLEEAQKEFAHINSGVVKKAWLQANKKPTAKKVESK